MIPYLDTLPLWTAFLPLGMYLVVVGVVHLSKKPVAISGSLDWTLLGVAIAGFMAVGPLALLQPVMGRAPWTVILLVVLCVLVVALMTLISRPRLVIYNISVEQLRPLLADVVADLDIAARWAGSTAALPTRHLEVRMDCQGPWRTISIVANGERAGLIAWADLCTQLRKKLRGIRVHPSPWAAFFIPLGTLILMVSLSYAFWTSIMSNDPVQSLGEQPDAYPRRPVSP
ncbi:MAG: hypothetical protein ABGW78_04145 [Pirellulales bacterium]